ncbi:Synaptobrevin like protein ykt6 [Astathelohania contejeani]|uniref:Synaptobrevin like protein ykt6 n=1 Tax=Astathelohania contejeani TaxID=164912 RepID=A0ABQ7I238_9MICR|nr:Synaptobrevin like protein ykt6 [Thelohania contejeani]
MILGLLAIEKNKIYNESYNLQSFSFFTRKSIRELIQLTARTIAAKLDTDDFQEFVQSFGNDTEYKFYTKANCDKVYIACTTGEYPQHIALQLLKEAERSNVSYSALITDYADYKAKDILYSVNRELDETKQILSRTLETVIGRGEKLDELVQSAESLSYQTKQLFEVAKKQNSCWCSFS